ncbi:MAG: zinc metallopeptidase [Firmicutes bacterium]|nr:zinc metallopeptidase [Bacillota bacterium]
MYFDWTFILLIPAILLAGYAQTKVTSTYNKYSKVYARRNITAAQLARQLLDMNGLNAVPIQPIRGSLTDNYDPRNKVLHLSETTYSSTSVAALGVAAHECGHAIQDLEGYSPLRLRNNLAPIASIGSSAAWIIFIAGLLMSMMGLVRLGILCFVAVVAFQLVTLPVEMNASNRALAALEGGGFLYDDELGQAKQVLSAAALTYVAAALTAILQLFRMLAISRQSSR